MIKILKFFISCAEITSRQNHHNKLTHNKNHHTAAIQSPELEAFGIFHAERTHAPRTYASYIYEQIVKMAMHLQRIIKSEFADTHRYDCTDAEDFKKKYKR